MGWWDEGIMGGDTPLDIEIWVQQAIGGKITKKRLDQNMEAVAALRDRKNVWYTQEHNRLILDEVIGYEIITTGADLSDQLRQQIIESVDADIRSVENDEQGWVDPAARIQRLKEFRAAVVAYDGHPVEITNKGLFQKMAEHFERN